jgi:hypothetical protein
MLPKIKSMLFVLVIIISLYLIIILVDKIGKINRDVIFGVSYSPVYAQYLGLDYQNTYTKIVKDLGFSHVRLMAQWDQIEKEKGKYDFTQLDWLMEESKKNNAKVILAVGRKTPRWPECHLPDWAKKKEYNEYRKDLLKYIEVVVKRYKDNAALEIWQVENEPFLPFGLCKTISRQDLDEEIKLVKKIDTKHKILITDSGELSTWRKTAKAGDLFGTTMYRVVWNKVTGYLSYDWLPSYFYKAKLKVFGKKSIDSYIIELQAEPWLPDKSVHETPLKEQYKSMDIMRFRKNVSYAQRVGMSRSYLWGVEWWYWMEKQNQPEFLKFVEKLKKK